MYSLCIKCQFGKTILTENFLFSIEIVHLQTFSCKNEGITCAEEIRIDTKLCLVPCKGLFADVKKLPPKNVQDEQDELFLERYKNYKRFFESSDGIFSQPLIYFVKLRQGSGKDRQGMAVKAKGLKA